jgi:hypothetical protein
MALRIAILDGSRHALAGRLAAGWGSLAECAPLARGIVRHSHAM